MKSLFCSILAIATCLAFSPIPAGAVTSEQTKEHASPPAPEQHHPATGGEYFVYSMAIGLGVVAATKAAKKEPFMGKLVDLPEGAFPGANLRNGDLIHGMIEPATKTSGERYVIDSHVGPIAIQKANIDLTAADEEDKAESDYKDLKVSELDAELEKRGIEADGLKADEKRAKLIDDDKAKVSGD